jgi:hypothetical protein
LYSYETEDQAIGSTERSELERLRYDAK